MNVTQSDINRYFSVIAIEPRYSSFFPQVYIWEAIRNPLEPLAFDGRIFCIIDEDFSDEDMTSDERWHSFNKQTATILALCAN